MSNSSNFNDDGFTMPMRWAARRIATATLLVLLVLAGLGVGIYSLLNNTSVSAPTTKHPSHSAIAKQPAPTNNSPVSAPSTASTQTQTTTSQSALVNTGPGTTSSLLYVFIASTLIGMTAHYSWRKLMRQRLV